MEKKPRSALVLERLMAGVWCMSCAGFWAPTRFGVPCSTSVLRDGLRLCSQEAVPVVLVALQGRV